MKKQMSLGCVNDKTRSFGTQFYLITTLRRHRFFISNAVDYFLFIHRYMIFKFKDIACKQETFFNYWKIYLGKEIHLWPLTENTFKCSCNDLPI